MVAMKSDAAVEISTPAGIVFRGRASAIDFHTTVGVISINALEETYLNVLSTARLTLRQREGSLSFELKNAAASWRDGTFTVLAEKAIEQPMNPLPANTSEQP